MADRISVNDRVAALAELERIADELNQCACWLMASDADAAAKLAERAAEKIAAACWILQSPFRGREPALLARWTLDAADGRRQPSGGPRPMN